MLQERSFGHLRISELAIPFTNAQDILRRLKSKYPTLDAKLVISSGYGQSELTTDGIALFDKVASMFANTYERKELLILLDTYKNLQRRNSELKSPDIKEIANQLHHQIRMRLETAEVIETSQINLIFGELDYELISKLQVDPLVDKTLTPQTGASIKICLGSLQYLRKWKSAAGQSDRVGVHMERHNAVF